MQEPTTPSGAFYGLIVHGLFICLIIYLVFGVLFAIYNLSYERREWECPDGGIPPEFFRQIPPEALNRPNRPEPLREGKDCVRRYSDTELAGNFIFYTVFGPAILTMRALHGGD